jgi:glycerol-3-phosphate O-acyltransferase / dihydroxyacetone phosphate acyltransferase
MKQLIRKIITLILRFAVRVFFRHIEVRGSENVPARGGVIFVLNHPNALVDPAFLLCLAPRKVSFLAKAPLFRMPVIGYFVRALDSLPVYRRQDEGSDVSRNRETFEAARELLKREGAIAICPEGVSHNEPRLLPIKSGAARIALGAAAKMNGASPLDVKIVPAGLYYTEKTKFRSAALLRFGAPISVESVTLDMEGDPPREAVQNLSRRITDALNELVLSASDKELWAKVMRAENIFSCEKDAANDPDLLREFNLRRAFLEAYEFHHARVPDRIKKLETRMARYEQQLARLGLEAEEFSHTDFSVAQVARYAVVRFIKLIVLAPLAVPGIILHYVAYRLAGFLARRFAREYEDMLSTVKVLAAMLLFPLTWAVIALLISYLINWRVGILSLPLTFLAGLAAIPFLEELDNFAVNAKALALYLLRRRSFHRLVKERTLIRQEIASLGEEAAQNR